MSEQESKRLHNMVVNCIHDFNKAMEAPDKQDKFNGAYDAVERMRKNYAHLIDQLAKGDKHLIY